MTVERFIRSSSKLKLNLFICDCCKSDISKMLNVSDETSCMHSTASLQTDSVHYNENNNATREKIKKGYLTFQLGSDF